MAIFDPKSIMRGLTGTAYTPGGSLVQKARGGGGGDGRTMPGQTFYNQGGSAPGGGGLKDIMRTIHAGNQRQPQGGAQRAPDFRSLTTVPYNMFGGGGSRASLHRGADGAGSRWPAR